MPVDTKHKQYLERESDWSMIADLLEGENAIKAAGTTYCPKLTGQTTPEFEDYIGRGSFYNAFARTVSGMTGAATRKEPNVEVDAEIKGLFEDITLGGKSFVEVVKQTIWEVMSFSGFGVYVDFSEEEQRPYWALYPVNSIINWKYESAGGSQRLSLLVLKETYDEQVDEFETKSIDQLRVVRLEEEGVVVELWRKGEKDKEYRKVEENEARIYGRRLDEIPFVFFGESAKAIVAGKPPLLDLAMLNVKHWQVSVDYFHGLHYCALPTPWAAGWPKDAKLYIGPKKAWVTEQPEAKCGFLEFSGQGLGPVKDALDKLEKQMAVMGARLLEEQKAGVETAEAIELRQSGDLSTLSSIVTVVEEGMIKALNFTAAWLNKAGNFKVELNRDFISDRLSAQDITALLQAVQAGRISNDTFLYNLRVGEILPPGRTIEDEKKLIQSEEPSRETPPPGGFEGFMQ